MDAGNLNCPMCGASVKSDSPKCLHCGTRLATVSCPSCFALMFDGSKFCPHCGARRERAAGEETKLHCPKCDGKALAHVSLGEAAISECPDCSGLWVDVATFESICADRERQSVVLGSASATFQPGQHPLELQIRYVRCPVCRELMHRVNFAKCSGIIIDVCKGHGSWFDRDELQHIVEFIRTGGLDLSRAKEKAELEQARRRLEAARTGRAGWEERETNFGTFRDTDLADIAGSFLTYLLTKD